jgi:transposase
MKIRSIGIDLGKTTFHLVALGERGKAIIKKKFSRKQLLSFTANLLPSLIGLEACAGSQFLGRALREQGHDVRLIPAQFVKPFVKSNKNDYLDAEAIAEAVERENMRFVPIKTDDQLDLQALHRVRDRLVSRRTVVINQLRAFLHRAKRGSKRHLICDGRGIPLAIELTGANCHDSTQALPLLDAIPPLPGLRGRPRCRPDCVLGDRAYDAENIHRALRARHILPLLAMRNTENGSGLGRRRWVIERTFAWMNQFRRLRLRYEKRADMHKAFLSLACVLICWNFLQGQFP